MTDRYSDSILMTSSSRTHVAGTDPRLAAGVIGGFAAAALLLSAALADTENETSVLAFTAMAIVAAAYLGIGLWVWMRRPRSRVGALICIGGLCLVVGTFTATSHPIATAIAALASAIVIAVDYHLIIVFPFGRVPGPRSRALVVVGYTVVIVGQIARLLTQETPMSNIVGVINVAAAAALIVASGTVLVRRLLRWARPRRRAALPFLITSLGATSLLSLVLLLPIGPIAQFIAQLVLLLLVPIAFALGALTGGLARQTALDDLDADVRAGFAADRRTLEARMAGLLGDASLTVGIWAPERGAFIDDAGLPLVMTDRSRGRLEIGREAVIDYDSEVADDAAALQRAARILEAALERDRLTTDLLKSRDEVRRSRARMGAAVDEERRRLATTLHDGLQVQLVLLGVDAARLRDELEGTAAVDADVLRGRIGDIASDIRRMAHDAMPPALVERGLVSAVSDLVDRLPVPTEFVARLGGQPLSDVIERSAFFVISEMLTNALKHAEASSIVVVVEQDDDVLRIAVADDGVGGASVGTGVGLRSISDRAEAAGGMLTVGRAESGGSRIVVELPCV